jgi:hypothetical protein
LHKNRIELKVKENPQFQTLVVRSTARSALGPIWLGWAKQISTQAFAVIPNRRAGRAGTESVAGPFFGLRNIKFFIFAEIGISMFN